MRFFGSQKARNGAEAPSSLSLRSAFLVIAKVGQHRFRITRLTIDCLCLTVRQELTRRERVFRLGLGLTPTISAISKRQIALCLNGICRIRHGFLLKELCAQYSGIKNKLQGGWGSHAAKGGSVGTDQAIPTNKPGIFERRVLERAFAGAHRWPAKPCNHRWAAPNSVSVGAVLFAGLGGDPSPTVMPFSWKKSESNIKSLHVLGNFHPNFNQPKKQGFSPC